MTNPSEAPAALAFVCVLFILIALATIADAKLQRRFRRRLTK